MKFKKFLMMIVGFALTGGIAVADVNNDRAYNPGAGNLDSLQSVFSGIGSSINVYTDQESGAIFNPTGAGTSSSSFVAQVTWGFQNVEVGMYKLGSPSTDVVLFNSAATPGTRVGINFNLDGSVRTFDADTLAVLDTQAGFGSSFGFYFKSDSGDPTWYSEDSLNSFGSNTNLVQALVYAGNGDVVTMAAPSVSFNDIGHYYVAFEGRHNDGAFGFGEGSVDFNDFVFQMESVTPVPEPEIYAMMVAGLGLMGFVARRRKPQVAV